MAITVPAVGDQTTASWGASVANTINGFFYGDANSTTNVTLSTASAFAGNAPVTFTLAAQTRVRIDVNVRFNPVSGVASRMVTTAGYNSGSSAVIGSFTAVGKEFDLALGTSTQASAIAFGYVLLAAGTYTAYASIQRAAGGGTTDIANIFYTSVSFAGFA